MNDESTLHPPDRISLIGAGPYDPEVLTIKALRAIQTADAQSRTQAQGVLARAAALPDLIGVPHRVLFSTRCFEQASVRIAEVA